MKASFLFSCIFIVKDLSRRLEWNAGAKDLEFIESGKSNFIFKVVPVVVDNSGVEKNWEVCIILTHK